MEAIVVLVELLHLFAAEVVHGREERVDLVERPGLRPQVEVHVAARHARLALVEDDVPGGVHAHRREIDLDLIAAERDVLIARPHVSLAAPERVLHPLLVNRVERDEVPGRRRLGGGRGAGQDDGGESRGNPAADRQRVCRERVATCRLLCQRPPASGNILAWTIREGSAANADLAGLAGGLGVRSLRRIAEDTSRLLTPPCAHHASQLRVLATNPHE